MMENLESHTACVWCGVLMSLKESKDSLCYSCRKYGCKKQALYFKYIKAHGLEPDVEQSIMRNWKKTYCVSCSTYLECYGNFASKLKGSVLKTFTTHRNIGRRKKAKGHTDLSVSEI